MTSERVTSISLKSGELLESKRWWPSSGAVVGGLSLSRTVVACGAVPSNRIKCCRATSSSPFSTCFFVKGPISARRKLRGSLLSGGNRQPKIVLYSSAMKNSRLPDHIWKNRLANITTMRGFAVHLTTIRNTEFERSRSGDYHLSGSVPNPPK